MKELEQKAIRELIDVYNIYILTGINKKLTDKAKFVYNEYIPANTLLGEKVMEAVGKLFPIAYPNVGSGLKPLLKKEARNIIKKLINVKNKII